MGFSVTKEGVLSMKIDIVVGSEEKTAGLSGTNKDQS